jgi:hypothetical protein
MECALHDEDNKKLAHQDEDILQAPDTSVTAPDSPTYGIASTVWYRRE